MALRTTRSRISPSVSYRATERGWDGSVTSITIIPLTPSATRAYVPLTSAGGAARIATP